MKKRKLLSLILACTFILSCCVAVANPVSAAEVTAMPTATPDGVKIDSSKIWLDWSALGLNVEGKGLSINEEGNLLIESNQFVYSGAGNNLLPEQTAWRGASGLMVYVDTTAVADGTTPNFLMCMLSNGSRPSSASNSASTGWTQITTINTTLGAGESVTAAYYYKNSAWENISATKDSNFLGIEENFTGWVYVPLTSFWYRGGSGANLPTDEAYQKNFLEFMGNFEQSNVVRIAVQSETSGIEFGDIHLVYQNPLALAGENTKEALFGTMTTNTNEGDAKHTISENSVTVSGMTGNSATSSANRVWLNGIATSNLDGASGLKFHVDTSKLDDGAKLRLRLRMQTDVIIGSGTHKVFKNGTGNFVPTLTWGKPQYVCHAGNSVAYYYDANGDAQPLSVQSNATTNAEGDLFEALPENYVGDIYIPFSSFWMSGISYNLMKLHVPFEYAAAHYPISNIAICHAIEGTTATDEVTYSNFEVVYIDDGSTKFTGASVTLENNLNVNFYAEVGSDIVAPTMEFEVGSKMTTVTGVKQFDGKYKFVCSDIIPQKVGDTITAKLIAKDMSGNPVKKTMEYSILQYCKNMLADPTSDAELKTLLVDLLYYGEAAQKISGYKTDTLVTGDLTEEQKALRSADTTSAITAEISKSGTASSDYKWYSASLRLESTLALKLKFDAANTEGLIAEAQINGRTVEFDEFGAGSGRFVIVLNQIAASEIDDEITLVLKKDGTTTGETVTCSIAAYIAQLVENSNTDANVKEIARAVYAYGNSVKSYMATVQS